MHGFPDTAHTWRHLLPRLADAGYRAVAPFLRGYCAHRGAGRRALRHRDPGPRRLRPARGARWRGRRGAHRPRLGGAPHLSGRRPSSRTAGRRLVTLAVPPVRSTRSSASSTTASCERSFYVFVFQTPLAEFAVGIDDLAFIDRLWADWSPGYDGYVGRRPGQGGDSVAEANLTAAIGYYRAMFAGAPGRPGGSRGPGGGRGDRAPAHPLPARHRRRLPWASTSSGR